MELRKLKLKELEDGIRRFDSRIKTLQKRSLRFGYYRLAILISGLSLFFFSFFYFNTLFTIISAIVFVIVFGTFTLVHNKIDYGVKKCKVWINIKKDNLARMNIDWKNIPSKNFARTENDHPFESDLNITGKNSLHQLIDISTSEEGSKKLRDWLLTRVPSIEIILERQKIFKELIPLQGFRNRLILNGTLASKKRLEGSKLSGWLKSEINIDKIKKIIFLTLVIVPINILLLVLFIVDLLPAYWSIGALIYVAIYWFNSKHINELFKKSLDVQMEFGKFSTILEFLEKYPALQNSKNARLNKMCSTFFMGKKSPSSYFKRLKRIILAASFQKHIMTNLLLNSFFPYDFFLAYKVEKWKAEMRDKLPEWLEIFYNLEAMISLSNFAYLNPEYVFPTFIENDDYIFNAENIAHPLLPSEINIHNDFSLTKKREVVIITGSNMSGKSTFVKTAGVNLALAFAGSVVNATKVETKLFRLFTCINISDSITDGISYFYAEVKRLKNILAETKTENEMPVFYLIDEIFKGTNNLERLIGSKSYIKALSGLNATGLISTHDLELIKLENDIPQISNYHFKEDVSNGKMIFDYQLRKGPSPTTNALKIMEIEGLPVKR